MQEMRNISLDQQRSYQDERQLSLGLARALLVTCLHDPFTMATGDGGGIPSSLLHEDAVATTANTQGLLHGSRLALDADGASLLQLRSPGSEERRVAGLTCGRDLIVAAVRGSGDDFVGAVTVEKVLADALEWVVEVILAP